MSKIFVEGLLEIELFKASSRLEISSGEQTLVITRGDNQGDLILHGQPIIADKIAVSFIEARIASCEEAFRSCVYKSDAESRDLSIKIEGQLEAYRYMLSQFKP